MAGVLLGAGLLWIAARGVSWATVGRALASANYGLVTLGVVCVVAATALRARCWMHLLGRDGLTVGFVRTWGILLISQAVNIGIPARVGDVTRVVLIGRAGRLSAAGAAATIVVEKFFDLMTLLLILIPIVVLIDMPVTLTSVRRGFVVVAIALPAVVLAAAWRGETVLRFLNRRALPIPKHWIDSVVVHGEAVLARLAVVRRWRDLALLQVGYLGVWLGLAASNYVVLRSVGVDAPPVAALVVLVVLQVGTSVPSTPGKVGVFQYLAVLALAPFGVAADLALTYGVLLHVVGFGPIIVLGGLSSWAGLAAPAARSYSNGSEHPGARHTTQALRPPDQPLARRSPATRSVPANQSLPRESDR